MPRVTTDGTHDFTVRMRPTAAFSRGEWSGYAASRQTALRVTRGDIQVGGRATKGFTSAVIFAPDVVPPPFAP